MGRILSVPIVITAQPEDFFGSAGATATFSVTAAGNGLSYQWQVSTNGGSTWGNILSTSGSMASTLGVHNPLRYRGYVYDTETGLYYLQSRYYDPEMGRFINADAFVSTGQELLGNNMFAYYSSKQPITEGLTVRNWLAGQSFSMQYAFGIDVMTHFK